MINIIDLDTGNFGSVENICKKLGIRARLSNHPDDIESADKLILPGVGSFDNAIAKYNSLGIDDIVRKKVYKEKIPILGICLGMQLMTESSEEGKIPGLGWIKGNTKKFNFADKSYRIPHMGWNEIALQKDTDLFRDMYEHPKFYFVHSYYVSCDPENSLANTSYGIEFTSAIIKDNILGVQFHPEKSHKYGMKLISNFAEYY